MKKTTHDYSIPIRLEEISSEFCLWNCHQCGQCSAVCPSLRHGGIKVGELMSRASLGSIQLGSERSVWLCAMCQSCSERCEKGVNPAEVITALRNACSDVGNRPDFFASEARRYLDTGLSFPKSGLTKKMRTELCLDDINIDQRAIEEIRNIAIRTSLGKVQNGQ